MEFRIHTHCCIAIARSMCVRYRVRSSKSSAKSCTVNPSFSTVVFDFNLFDVMCGGRNAHALPAATRTFWMNVFMCLCILILLFSLFASHFCLVRSSALFPRRKRRFR